ncbi:peptidoglycan/xylan/chitin deacetylase (PgdA/CDA1 family) [Azospirillum lipoferum]|uniref:Chitooligosaccharide deacetylase n=1 Tax=Azospirillum lipoferum TaxID=193 RepID=A0A5A9G414_AZOLI|nr:MULTISPECIES: polysaccharide deacetylase family protein [Azospirillum]KAA0588454.1 polysaccharide deacetylase family protein [Azospirillum lipoferum]MCP1615227.1 peptidoglycan/xylan/chitin deacetylase (PgdA/CDA1 family) [Azospirillum lipoferum]MDW5534078.1 polysaccharide deacetylase family protein [Azospirillum sp. NL1]
MLPSHNRFPYSAITDRPDFSWPGGKRLAVYVALCIEHFPYGSGLGLPYSPGLSHPNSYNWAWREYGNRVGGWRLIDLFDAHRLPLTVLLNTECYEHCPELVTALRRRGDEIVAHGRTNGEHQNGMSLEEERRLIAEATEAIRLHEGKPPAGWMSPGAHPSANTEDLLAEAGYRYTLDWPIDDQPVWMRTTGGPLLSVPYPHEVNDVPMVVLHDGTAPAFADMAIDNFDEMLRQSKDQPLAYGITIHSFIVGQPFRIKQFRRVLEHLDAHRDEIWFATAGQIADHFAGLMPPPATTAPASP